MISANLFLPRKPTALTVCNGILCLGTNVFSIPRFDPNHLTLTERHTTNKKPMSKHTKTILIMAGGTGGHIFPALAVSKALNQRSTNIEWLGSKCGMENTLVPKHNIPLHTVSAVGLRGKNMLTLVKAPFLLSLAFIQTVRVFAKVNPSVVLGMGGFASGIGGLVAWLLRVPLVIHEQNSIPGTTNKLLSKIATQTFQAFNDTFEQSNKVFTSGNPVLFKPKKKSTNNKKTQPINRWW